MIDLQKYTYKILGKWHCRYKAFNLKQEENQELKSILEQDGFFNFNLRNNGFIVYYHQIIAFYKCGGIHALKRGMICDSNIVEVHHLNGDTLDNRSDNLIYIPRIVHCEITTIQRRLCKYLKTFRRGKGCNIVAKCKQTSIWNKQGRIITNCLHFIMYVLIRTIKASSITFSKIIIQKRFTQWLKKTYKNLQSFLPLYHLPVTWVE